MADPLRQRPVRSVLGRGETLIEAAVRRQRGFPKPLPRSYAEARHRLFTRLAPLRAEIGAIPPADREAGEVLLAVRLHPDFLAAAFEPASFLRLTPSAFRAGARRWRAPLAAVAETPSVRRDREAGRAEGEARLVFVAVEPEPFLAETRAVLERAEGALPQAVRHDLQRIERIDFLAPGERIEDAVLGDPGLEERRRIELVLHPSAHAPERRRVHLLRRLEEAGIDPGELRFRPYPGAPIFVSLLLDRDGLGRLRGYNPLRTARLLGLNPFPMLRAAPVLAAPQPPPRPAHGAAAPVRVAVFDGGFDSALPLLAGYAAEGEGCPSRLPPHPDCVAHGTAVAGALLHGPLNPHAAADVLPPPPVAVVGYRVFPLSDPADFDLYEAIDAVERVVPKLGAGGVRIVNFSFGPRGPVSDDNVSRFTYVLDRLAYDWDFLPVVAVGNDGGRIQAPGDSVNSLSVGAYGFYGGQSYPVPYSCRGPGREGGKGKPDLAAFGGCERTPIHLVSARSGLRVLDHGTSFAAPLAARLAAQVLARCPDLPPLLLRALLIHHSAHPGAGFDYALGHGFLPDDIDGMVGCPPKTVSVLLHHAVAPKSVARLPIPLPPGVAKGRVEVSWTFAVLAPVDPRSSLEYTGTAVAATFYPDSRAYMFAPPAFLKPRPAPRRLDIVAREAEAAALLAAGWTRADYPVSKAANVYRPETGLRSSDLKWDTVVRARLALKGESLHEPFLLLQASARNGETRPVRFGGVLTLRMPKAETDIYDEVVRAYPSLQKVAVQVGNEVRIQV